MKLISNEIQKNLELGENFLLRKWYKKYVWKLGRAYGLGLNVLGKEDKDAKKKNKLWVKFLLSPDSIDSKKYLKLQKHMNEHSYVVNQAIELMSKSQQKDAYEGNQIFKHTKVVAPLGLIAYELPE